MLVAMLSAAVLGVSGFQTPELPILEVSKDNTRITASCLVRIAPNVVITDSDGNGVLHVAADHIHVEFEPGTVLRGASNDSRGDQLTGIGVRIDGHRGVTLSNVEVSGFRCGVLATSCDDLTVDGMSIHHNFRQHLKSTPAAEDSGDWLWPHDNDEQQWRKNYGAGLCVERSAGVNIQGVKAREQQNGIILDRVAKSVIRANDCSFLSGWGLAMWRSSDNLIEGNHFDFCIRGYSHGVYNRGQDSAGILMFEQCSNNQFIDNSVTHGGDGIFAFSGREALGQAPAPSDDFSYERRGNNGNLFRGNDLSYAAAHGLELTFGFDNRIENNLFKANAICGFWGGFSQDTLIEGNLFQANGDAGYGLERGGVNIDHSRNNVIVGNVFASTKCGIHLWSLPSGLTETPWGIANCLPATGNIIVNNGFTGDGLAVHLRGHVAAQHNDNEHPSQTELSTEVGIDSSWLAVMDSGVKAKSTWKSVKQRLADSAPLNLEIDALGGREAIIMTEWGPWDHQAPMLRQVSKVGARHEYDLLPIGTEVKFAFADPDGAAAFGLRLEVKDGRAAVVADDDGYAEYQLIATTSSDEFTASGWFLLADWQVTVFNSPCDPREDEQTWRAGAKGDSAVTFPVEQLNLIYGMGGPGGLPQLNGIETVVGSEAFGTIATSSLQLNPGMWKFRMRSDDGVRVLVDGKPLIENWTWHAPTIDEAIIKVVGSNPKQITVEHFELDGYSTLELQIEPFM